MRGILIRRLYWDSSDFLGLINPEEAKHDDCRAVWEQARRGEGILFTSFWTFAEVFKPRRDGPAQPLTETQDKNIEALLRQPWVQAVVVDERIGTASRRLMRQHSDCKNPSHAVHLATALALNVDEMHTHGKSDLIRLSGKVLRADGVPLKICAPYIPEPPLALPIPSSTATPEQRSLLFEAPDEEENAE
jgi:predicted nucleic acid-binding protein